MPPARYSPIADYALIGDCHTSALVSRDGSLDWYCPSRFDAPAAFCRLLDADRGGWWRLAPAEAYTATRAYDGPTNVLQTTFNTTGGTLRVTDLMSVYDRGHGWAGYDVGCRGRILRLVEAVSGTVTLRAEFKPTLDFARTPTRLTPTPGQSVLAEGTSQRLALACPGLDLTAASDGALVGQRVLQAGERCWLALTTLHPGDDPRPALALPDADAELADTLSYWQRWSARSPYRGPYAEIVRRSALVLKLLTYEPTGAVVAAPTTSLPEWIGGVRNWDYRYTWLRDTSLMLSALASLGYEEEADDFFGWLYRTFGGPPSHQPQIMYAIDGGRDLPERIVDGLAGYSDSAPVRVGNAAVEQRQHDIYGSVLDAAHLHYQPASHTADTPLPRPSADVWALLTRLVELTIAHWNEPGQGIWERRGPPEQGLYSKVMCWVALDRGVRLAEAFALSAPLDRWRAMRETIRNAVLEQGWNASVGAFTQSFGSTALDASALVIPRVGFLPATDARVESTVRAIRAHLTKDGLVQRYLAPDGLPGGEGAFLLCSFWLVDALAGAGQLDEARTHFEHLIGFANDLNLLSEEVDPRGGALLGNFPQGFTHLAVIESAVNLARAAAEGAEQAPRAQGDRLGPARLAVGTHAPAAQAGG